MVKVLEGLGQKPSFAKNVTCCGQPPFNSGYSEAARTVAAAFIDGLRDVEELVVGSGSCATMVKVFLPQLFAETPRAEAARSLAGRTWEFADYLVSRLGVSDVGARFSAKVTIHDGCHALRELGLKKPMRTLLAAVRDLTLLEMDEAETCCGFGGSFSVKFPMISTAMGEQKCSSAAETGADYLVSCDSSCLMHLRGLLSRQQSPLKTLHLAEVLTAR
jgi:L-lactate dehydrogenase complex protein LldE